jgi:hypothetical protein
MNTLPELVDMTNFVVKGVIIYTVVMILIAVASSILGSLNGK